VVFGVALAFMYRKNKVVRSGSLAAVAAVIIVIGLTVVYRDSSLLKQAPLIGRFTNIELSDTTVQQRLFSWRTGWRAFQDRPFLGWGAENYNAAFNTYFDAQYYYLVRSGTYFDKAHNVVIEFLVTTGVVGLGSYLLLLTVMLYYVCNLYRNDPGQAALTGALVALLAAYTVQNLLVFDTVVTYVAFFLVMGYAYAGRYFDDNNSQTSKFFITRPVVRRVAILCSVLLAFYLGVWHNIQPARSAYYMRHALNEANKRPYRYADFSALMRRSFSFGTVWDAEYVIEYTAFYKQLRAQPNVDAPAVLADARFITAAGERYTASSHNDVKFISQLAGMYELAYEYGQDEADLARGEELIKQAILLSPQRVFFYHILAQLYEFNGRDDEAIQVLEQSRLLNDDLGETYWALGLMYSKLSRHEEAITAVKEAVKRRVTIDDPDSILEIAPIFEQEKDYASALFLYQQLVGKNKTNTDYHAKIAALHAVMGNDEQAIAVAYQIININTSLAPQVERFIDEVKAGKFREQENKK